jgi:hypothetical protein
MGDGQMISRITRTAWCVILLLFCGETASAGDLKVEAETGLRKSLTFYKERQHEGGWASAYSLDLKSRWGEWKRVGPEVLTVNHSATTGIGLIFLRASIVLNEPSWLECARKAADLLVAGQLKNGGFPEELRVTNKGVKPIGNQGVLEDHATDRATELLLQLFDATGDDKYLAAGRKAVDFLIKAQYPSGAFPQRFPIKKKAYSRHCTINDGATSDPILRLISFHRRTGEEKYLTAAKKAGDWLLSAVLPDPTPGWAEQYDKNNVPTKARKFEPAGAGTEVTLLALQALIELHLMTGEDKYLGPVPKAIKWLDGLQIHPGGKCYRLYNMKSCKPMFVDRNTGKIYNELDKLPEDQRFRWYMGPFFVARQTEPLTVVQTWKRLESMGREKLLAQRMKYSGRHDIESGYMAFRVPLIESEEDRLALTEEVKRILGEQKEAGWWPGQWYGTDAITSSLFTKKAIKLITWLELNTNDKANPR